MLFLTKIEDIRGNVEVDDDDEDEEEEDMEVEVDKLEGGESGSQNLGDRTCRQCNKVFHKPSQLGRVKWNLFFYFESSNIVAVDLKQF